MRIGDQFLDFGLRKDIKDEYESAKREQRFRRVVIFLNFIGLFLIFVKFYGGNLGQKKIVGYFP